MGRWQGLRMPHACARASLCLLFACAVTACPTGEAFNQTENGCSICPRGTSGALGSGACAESIWVHIDMIVSNDFDDAVAAAQIESWLESLSTQGASVDNGDILAGERWSVAVT